MILSILNKQIFSTNKNFHGHTAYYYNQISFVFKKLIMLFELHDGTI